MTKHSKTRPRYNRPIAFKMTEEQEQQLQEAVEQSGLPMGSFVRDLVLRGIGHDSQFGIGREVKKIIFTQIATAEAFRLRAELKAQAKENSQPIAIDETRLWSDVFRSASAITECMLLQFEKWQEQKEGQR
jgi:hypothetical protein